MDEVDMLAEGLYLQVLCVVVSHLCTLSSATVTVSLICLLNHERTDSSYMSLIPSALYSTLPCFQQALHHSYVGEHAIADQLLTHLGCNYKLSPAIWDECHAQRSSSHGYASNTAAVLTQGCTGDHQQPSSSSRQHPVAGDSSMTPHGATHDDGVAGPDARCSVYCYASPLPQPLLHRLQHGFRSTALFWQQHCYDDPATPFFSYCYDLVGGTW